MRVTRVMGIFGLRVKPAGRVEEASGMILTRKIDGKSRLRTGVVRGEPPRTDVLSNCQ